MGFREESVNHEMIMAGHVATASLCIYSSATVKAGNPRVDYSLKLV